MAKARRRAIAAGILALLVPVTVAAVGSSSAVAGSKAAASPAASGNDAWALTYTGGKAGAADKSLSPIKIQYVNQQGGTLSFTKVTQAANAAAAYINAKLGGVGGHPIQLVNCFVQTEEDGQKCGTQLVNDDSIKAAMLGTVTVGNQSYFATVAGKKTIFLSAPATGPDLAAKPNVYAFNPGGLALISGMAIFTAKTLKPKTISVIVTDNAVGKFIGPLFGTVAKAHGSKAKITSVYIPPNATTPQITSAVQASGAASADVIVPILVSATCDATAKALKSLDIKKTVVASAGCFAPEVMPPGDKIRSGWYFGNWGTLPFIASEKTGTNTYVRVMKAAGLGVGAADGQDRIFSTLMTMDRFMNKIGPDNLTTNTFAAAVKAFKGPVMMTPGKVACGVQKGEPSLCTTEVGLSRYVNGKWISVEDAANGHPIDPSKP